jgi:tetratricopeptide (TPR) repeat protein
MIGYDDMRRENGSTRKAWALESAERCLSRGKVAEAIARYREAVAADPEDFSVLNTLGDLYIRAGRVREAMGCFSLIADHYRSQGYRIRAVAMLKKMLKYDPACMESRKKLADLFRQQGHQVEACHMYLQAAAGYERLGQQTGALEIYKRLAGIDPSDTLTRMKIGGIYSRLGFDEQSHDAFMAAGAEFLRRGEVDSALDAYTKALSALPGSTAALRAITAIHIQRGDTEHAIKLLRDALEKDPDNSGLLELLGCAYVKAESPDKLCDWPVYYGEPDNLPARYETEFDAVTT